jgi:peptidoglycan/LPS O-acetylase OafA/YrhL
VVIYHVRWITGPFPGWFGRAFDAIALRGWLGVQLFLVISGFCLFWPLTRKGFGLDVGKFARRRAARILPPYYVALSIYAGLIAFGALREYPLLGRETLWPDVLLHALMLHNLTENSVCSISGPFWSLALECQLYVLFPLLVCGVRKCGPWVPVALLGAIAIIWIELCPRWTTSHWASEVVYYNALPAQAFGFGLGVLAAWLLARPRASIDRWVVPAGTVALASAVLVFRNSNDWQDKAIGAFLMSIVFACAVFWFGRCRLPAGFAWRRLFALGAFSYSVYMVHQGVFELVRQEHLEYQLAPWAHVAVYLVVVVPVAVGISYLFHLAFERPFMQPVPRAALMPAEAG